VTRITSTLAPAILAATLLVAGCSSPAGGGPTDAPNDQTGTTTVGVTTLFPTGTFAEFVARLDEIGPDAGFEFDIQDINNDVTRENQILSGFATRGVDMVFTSIASSDGSRASVERLAEAGIPVICYNTCLAATEGEQLTAAFVSDDQRQLGVSTGEALAAYIEEELGGSATVGYLTCETYDVCRERRDGLDEQLADLDVTVAADQEGFVVDAATPVATAMLTANPDIDIIIAENEDAIIAASNAIDARGLQGQVVVFGIGINPAIAQLLLDDTGNVLFTTGQDATAWADEVIAVATAIRDGADTGEWFHPTVSPTFSRGDTDALTEYIEARS